MTNKPNPHGRYPFAAIEAKWRAYWQAIDLYQTGNDPGKPDVYILDFFPYPSGDGLSVGHGRNYVPTCVSARFLRMNGHNVLHPMGWDAFGLPAENYAIRHGIHPRQSSAQFSATYKRQMQLLECSYDWSREISSTDPAYYRWTQWFFLLLFRRGLAYRAPGSQWWCSQCQTILANEQVEDGRCWRCGTPVVKKELEQWYFKITAYADRLLADLDTVDWPEAIKTMQRNWIGPTTDENGATVGYHLHDWLISRQRYWGTPIPIVHCPACGPVAVPEAQLPILLPDITDFAPAGDGRSPLARMTDWVQTTCPQCGGPAQRETDTMDGFACSSWYFLRFANPQYDEGAFDPTAVRRWLPVDTYVGGAEHAVMHLLYARFWTKVMADAGLIDFVEPFTQLRNQGILLAASDGRRMSKSRGNVVTPDAMIARYGADALRAYLLFLGPFDAEVTWDEAGIRGVTRFLDKFWRLAEFFNAKTPRGKGAKEDAAFERRRHQVIQRVTEDMAEFRFNTAVAALMEYLNYLTDGQGTAVPAAQWRRALESFALLLAPICPFISEEVWQTTLGHDSSVHRQAWPAFDEALTMAAQVTLPVQVNGKVRDRIEVAVDAAEKVVEETAVSAPGVEKHVNGRAIQQIIIVPNKLVNIVVGS
ncbi:MAG: leucine--tRNA ligase [Candidatus Promineifilaceae bacterium]|nr:leucine--tRNA ligase [Chloroflexota bacterium]